MTVEMDGSGTEQDPYQITNVKELRAVNEDLSAYYELVCDINAEDCDLLISRNNCNISYIIDTNTLYLELDNKTYSCPRVSLSKANRLAQSLREEIVEVSEHFGASVVASKNIK